jgi:hypothetical protein
MTENIKDVMEQEAYRTLNRMPQRYIMGCNKPIVKYVPLLDQWCTECKKLKENLEHNPNTLACKCVQEDGMCKQYLTAIKNRARYQGIGLCCIDKLQEVKDIHCGVGMLCGVCIEFNTMGKWVNWHTIRESNGMIKMTLHRNVQRKKANLTRCNICTDYFPSTRRNQSGWYFIGTNRKYEYVICPKHLHLDINEIKLFLAKPYTIVIKSYYSSESVIKELYRYLTTPVCIPSVLLELIIQYLFH